MTRRGEWRARWLASATLSALAVVFATLAWHKIQLAVAEEAFARWVAGDAAPSEAAVEQALERASRLPDPETDWLKVRWLMARNPADPAVPELLSRFAEARPFDYRPAVAGAQWAFAAGGGAEDLERAVRAVVEKAPNESRVFAQLFPRARVNWHRLNAATRRLVEEFALRTAVREPDLVIELGRDYGYGGVLCEATVDLPLAQRACRRLGLTGESP